MTHDVLVGNDTSPSGLLPPFAGSCSAAEAPRWGTGHSRSPPVSAARCPERCTFRPASWTQTAPARRYPQQAESQLGRRIILLPSQTAGRTRSQGRAIPARRDWTASGLRRLPVPSTLTTHPRPILCHMRIGGFWRRSGPVQFGTPPVHWGCPRHEPREVSPAAPRTVSRPGFALSRRRRRALRLPSG